VIAMVNAGYEARWRRWHRAHRGPACADLEDGGRADTLLRRRRRRAPRRLRAIDIPLRWCGPARACGSRPCRRPGPDDLWRSASRSDDRRGLSAARPSPTCCGCARPRPQALRRPSGAPRWSARRPRSPARSATRPCASIHRRDFGERLRRLFFGSDERRGPESQGGGRMRNGVEPQGVASGPQCDAQPSSFATRPADGLRGRESAAGRKPIHAVATAPPCHSGGTNSAGRINHPGCSTSIWRRWKAPNSVTPTQRR